MVDDKAGGPAAMDQPLEVARDLNSGAIHLLRGMREVDRESGLTPARLSALSVLVFGGPATVGRLAAVEGVASPSMIRVIVGLVALGLAERTAHPDSARAVLVTATGAGQNLMAAAALRRFETIAAAMAELPGPDRDALAAAALPLRRLAAIIRRDDAPPVPGPGPPGPGERRNNAR